MTFHTSRVLPHPPEEVFDAFARPELLARWWGPRGFTNTFETFEFEAGGHWKFVMHGPNGSNHPNESVFLGIERPARIVIRHVSPPHFVLTVALAPLESGTRIDWTQAFDDPRVAAGLRQVVEPANEENLDRLAAVLGQVDATAPRL